MQRERFALRAVTAVACMGSPPGVLLPLCCFCCGHCDGTHWMLHGGPMGDAPTPLSVLQGLLAHICCAANLAGDAGL